MREPDREEFAGFDSIFDPFQSATRVFKQPSSTGTGHLSLDSRRREDGCLERSLSLSSVSCVLNTNKHVLNVFLTLICVGFILSIYLKDSIQRVYTQTFICYAH